MLTLKTAMTYKYLIVTAKTTFISNWLIKTGLGLLAAVTSFIIPIQPYLILIGGLVTADFITGIIAAKKSKEQIQSVKMSRTITKFIAYGIGILVGHAITVTLMPNVQVAYFAALFVMLTEAQSVYENIYTITGVNIWAVVKDLFKGKIKP